MVPQAVGLRGAYPRRGDGDQRQRVDGGPVQGAAFGAALRLRPARAGAQRGKPRRVLQPVGQADHAVMLAADRGRDRRDAFLAVDEEPVDAVRHLYEREAYAGCGSADGDIGGTTNPFRCKTK